MPIKVSPFRTTARLAGKKPAEIAAYVAAAPAARRLARGIDRRGLARLEARYRDAAPAPGYSKYLDADHWVHSKLLRVRRMGLHRTAPLRLLDLGTGPAYFPYLAQAYGHDVLGVDMAGVDFYDEIVALLGVRRELWTIRPFEAMPNWGVFERITAFQICFDQSGGSGPEGRWAAREWAFFLDDVARQMTADGRLTLEFNTPPDADVAALLRARGATVGGLISESGRPLG